MTGGSQNDEPSAAPRQRPWSTGVDVPLPASAGFSKHELWAWARIVRGLDANMALYPGDAADPADDAWIAGRDDQAGFDPKDAAAWPAHRTLSERFLRTILFHEPWASAPERPVVGFVYARIAEPLDWQGRATRGQLWFHGCRFEGAVSWLRLRVAGLLSLQGACFVRGFAADGAVIEGDFLCGQGFTAEGDVRLLSARIEGQAAFNGAILNGAFDAGSATFRSHVFCSDGFGAKGKVSLNGSRIGGQASFSGATLHGALDAQNAVIEGVLFLRDAERLGEVNLIAARIGRDLQLRQSRIEGRVDLTGARIEGELHLEMDAETPGPVWGPDACLILRNTRAVALAGSIAAFQRPSSEKKMGVGKKAGREPIPVELSGFHYERLGGLGASASATLAAAPVAALKRLLASRPKGADGAVDRGFDAQPYLALADALEAAGRRDAATRLRIAANDHERDAPNTPWRRRLGLAVSSALVGYGHRNARALFWLLALALGSGGLGLALAGEGLGADALGRWAWFGLDNALPLLELDKAHEGFLAARFGRAEGEPAPLGVASVFYAARILGFGIITFFVAGLTGFAAGSKR